MRLIDADKLIVPDKDCSGKCRDCNNHVTNCMELADLVNDAPTIDAVEVVRCRDCKYGLKVVSPITAIFCTRFGEKDMAVEDDDFCSYGERGEKDE